jgi:hypothetical protein
MQPSLQDRAGPIRSGSLLPDILQSHGHILFGGRITKAAYFILELY